MAKFFNDNSFNFNDEETNQEVVNETPSFVSATSVNEGPPSSEEYIEEYKSDSNLEDNLEVLDESLGTPQETVNPIDGIMPPQQFYNTVEEAVPVQEFDNTMVEEPIYTSEINETLEEPDLALENSVTVPVVEEQVTNNEVNLNATQQKVEDISNRAELYDNRPVEEKKERDSIVSIRKTSEVEKEEENIDNSFTNVETTYVEDTSYKGVDNTGKVGEDIQNPVYIDKLERSDVQVSGNILAIFLVLIEIMISPGKSIIRNTEKYVKGKKVFKVFCNVLLYEFIFSFVGHIIGGCFVSKLYNGDIRKVLDFSNILKLNYLDIFVSTFVVCVVLVLLITIINYATSFFSNKGLSFGTYLLIIELSMFPLALCINALMPILGVMSIYLSLGCLLIAIMYSLLIYTNAIWGLMEFKGDNSKLFYLLINFILIVLVVIIIIIFFYEDPFNTFIATFK